MKKLTVLSLFFALQAFSAFGAEGDLVLKGERWIAKFNKYVCSTDGAAVSRPAGLDSLNVVFQQITTDITLDNVLLKATFEQNGQTCNYSALLLADNATNGVKLVESKSFAPVTDGDCSAGRATLDAALSATSYLYYGHPHNVAILLPVSGADAVCAGASAVAANFQVAGKIQ